MTDMLFNTDHYFLLTLRLSIRFGYPKYNRRYHLCRKKLWVIMDKQTVLHHSLDNFLIHLLYADKLMAGGDLGKSFITKLLLYKKLTDFANHRVINGECYSSKSTLYKIFPAFGNLSDVLLRAEGFLVTFFRRIDQRVQNILFALEMLVKRRRFDTDLFCNLFHTGTVVTVLSKQRQRFFQYSIFCRHHFLQIIKLIIISLIIANNY